MLSASFLNRIKHAFPLLVAPGRVMQKLRRGNLIKQYLLIHPQPKLHIGCGLNVIPGWLNTDLKPDLGKIIPLDGTRVFPFSNESFNYVFSEHFFEHLTYDDGQRMLSESYRILRSGGTIRITTPNAAQIAELYRKDLSPVQQQYIEWSHRVHSPGFPPLAGATVNTLFYGFGHRFLYDPVTLRSALEKAGFINMKQFDPGVSEDPVLKNLEGHGGVIGEAFNRLESMTFEGTKS